ncbi:MAG: DNA-processing protein DprA [Candidatus Paceibacterota bacterium]|nr:DNA-processing protein DprA [Candidatus Nomurabacteria bacterium]
MYELPKDKYPKALNEIPHPPKKLYVVGDVPDDSYFFLTIVGSRKYTAYGKSVCEEIINGLKGYPIVIVSGLAMGIDTLAHECAMKAGLKTIAFPGSGLSKEVLYPRSNMNLAKRIVENGGCVISEFEPDVKAARWTFPQRNRLMAGISQAVLIIEAEEKSGTLITSKLAIEYNKEVMTVPGNIFSETSKGPHMLLRLGATPVTSYKDILTSFGLEEKDTDETIDTRDLSEDEIKVLQILRSPKTKDDLLGELGLPIQEANTLLSILEIKGLIKEELGEFRRN